MRISQKGIFLVLFVCFTAWNVDIKAQDFNNYRLLKSSGEIPKKFLVSGAEKYNAEVDKLSTKEKARYRRAKKEFFLESSFVINDMLLSGKVLFNDPVGIYVNKVVDEILKNDKDLRSKVEVYVIKSNEVNAFTMANTGMIFITVGLIAQVENEAELAMVLCHEITHFVNQHALNAVVENTDIKYGKGSYRGKNLDDKLLARSNFSKKEESEADLQGLDRFLKSEYDPMVYDGEFDVLQYSHLPFDELPYKKSFLETANFKFPNNYFLDKVKDIEARETEDSLATHPAIQLRRAAVKDKLAGMVFKDKKKYIVGKKEFLLAQKTCRYEMCTIFLHYREYEPAVYNCYLLLQDDPKSLYLKKCLGKALYGLSKYANANRYDEAHDGYKDIQGSSQQVYYFFDKISKSELNVLAVAYLYDLKKQYPEDKEIAALANDMLGELPQYYKEVSFFSNTPRQLNTDTTLTADHTTKEKTIKNKKDDDDESEGEGEDGNTSSKSRKSTNKYDKINKETKLKEEIKQQKDRNYFAKYAFVDLLGDKNFVADYNKAIEAWKQKSVDSAKQEKESYKQAIAKREKKERRQGGVNLGLEKLVIVNPFYYKVDNGDKVNVKLIASEEAQKDLNNQVKENAQKAGLNYELLDKKDLNANATNLFNDIAVLNYYKYEVEKLDSMHFVNYMTDDIQELVKNHGTKYFNWGGIVSYREHSEIIQVYSRGLLVCTSIYLPVLMPFTLYNLIRPRYSTYLYSAVYNLGDGGIVADYAQKIKYKDRRDILNSALYNTYLHYKTEKQK